MSHSKEQMRKKEEAMKESMHHIHHANVTHARDGRDHESHKVDDMRRGSPDAGDMGSSDKFSMGY